LTENAGHELQHMKLTDQVTGMKTQDMKMTDQFAGREIAGHDFDGPNCGA